MAWFSRHFGYSICLVRVRARRIDRLPGVQWNSMAFEGPWPRHLPAGSLLLLLNLAQTTWSPAETCIRKAGSGGYVYTKSVPPVQEILGSVLSHMPTR